MNELIHSFNLYATPPNKGLGKITGRETKLLINQEHIKTTAKQGNQDYFNEPLLEVKLSFCTVTPPISKQTFSHGVLWVTTLEVSTTWTQYPFKFPPFCFRLFFLPASYTVK